MHESRQSTVCFSNLLICRRGFDAQYLIGVKFGHMSRVQQKSPFASGTKGTLRGTTLLETVDTRFHSTPVTAAAVVAYDPWVQRRSFQASSAFPNAALPVGALPRSHRVAALCGDGLLLLFATFAR
jgi:hypothetical protein